MTFAKRVAAAALLGTLALATACEADQERGVCFFRWTDGQGGVNQHCDAMLDSAAQCDALADATVTEGWTVTDIAWMPECADARCTGTCHPDWYAVYGGG